MEQDTVASGLEYTIFRPSFIFGRGGALATFMKQVRYSPVVTVIGSGQQRIQPIWLDDVAEHFARALETPAAANKTFEIGGPDIVTWDELYRTIAKVLGKRRALLHIPAGLASTGARATQWIPKAPLSTDQVAMIEAGDNIVTNSDAVHTFQLPLVPLEDQIRRAA
jgi:NADH dehydrogenase